MYTTRERWVLLIGWLLFLGAGNYVANAEAPTRALITYIVIVLGFVTLLLVCRAGVFKSSHVIKLPLDGGRTPFFLGITSVFLATVVLLTGGIQSPLFSVLYAIPLIAALQYGILPGLITACGLAISILSASFDTHHLSSMTQGASLSFPLAALLGLALRDWRENGFRSISTRVAEQDSLMDVSRMLETATDLETTVNLLLINAQFAVNADFCAIYFIDQEHQNLQLAAPFGPNQPVRFAPTLSVSALEERGWKLCSDDDLALDRTCPSEAKSAGEFLPESVSTSAMAACLVGSEGILGILYVGRAQNKAPFNTEDTESLKKFAFHVSMPLQKAKYQDSLSALAFKDPMTGLANFRYFEQRLSEEFYRAKRYYQSTTLIMVDIDFFKKFNDVYGHKAGDSLLKRFGVILKECLRESDLAARYGGEEFVAICPGINSEEARIVAERIRTSVEQCKFDLGESLLGESPTVNITVSIGTASYPRHAQDPSILLRQADRALYAAKERGRNISVSCDDIPSIHKTIDERNAA